MTLLFLKKMGFGRIAWFAVAGIALATLPFAIVVFAKPPSD
jgi:hypothetical protein